MFNIEELKEDMISEAMVNGGQSLTGRSWGECFQQEPKLGLMVLHYQLIGEETSRTVSRAINMNGINLAKEIETRNLEEGRKVEVIYAYDYAGGVKS